MGGGKRERKITWKEKTGTEREVWTGGHTPGQVTDIDTETEGEEDRTEQREEMER